MVESLMLSKKMEAKWFLVLLLLELVNGDMDARTEVLQNGIFKMPTDLTAICENLKRGQNVTEKCASQLDVVCGNLTLFSSMLSASSRFPYVGQGYATKRSLGNFEQCLSIDHTYDGGRILGEYCTLGLSIPDVYSNVSNNYSNHLLSVCRPDGCFASDYHAIVDNIIDPEFPENFQDYWCQTVNSNATISTMDIVTLSIFAICIWLMIISTVYDMYIYCNQRKNCHPLFTAFSMLSNGKKLLHVSKHSSSKEQIEVFYGFRVISLMWIVAGHGIEEYRNASVTNRATGVGWVNRRYSLYINTAPLAVDTFFYMSGFLLAFQYLKYKGKPFMRQLLSVPYMYIHRYIRITPALIMVYLTVISLFRHLGSGPLWPLNDKYIKNCADHSMSFLLYIQNYYNKYEDICMCHTWYVSADMQIFVISPLILIPLSITLRKSSRFMISMVEMLIVNVFIIFICMATTFYFPDQSNNLDTHSSLINYFIGIMMGVFMREKIDKPFLYMTKEHRRSIINIVVWVLILLGMLTTVACLQELFMDKEATISYMSYSLIRSVWCVGLSWIVYSCYHGYGGFVNWILCRPIFQVFGRLTYCIYLVHGLVIQYYISSARVPWFFSDYETFYMFCGHYVVSVIIAIFWTLAFESPFIVIEKYVTGGGRKTVEIQSAVPQSENVEESTGKDVPQNGNELHGKVIDINGLYKTNNEVY